MPYAPTVTPSTDMAPSPRVLVVFSTLAAGTQTVTVYRVADGRTMPVAGGVKLFAVGGASVMDYTPALGVANSYRAQMFDASGNDLGYTDATTVTIATLSALVNTNRVVISQPLKPALAIQATMLLGTASDMVAPSPGSVYWAEGSSDGTWIGGQRQGLKDVPVRILCDSTADADELQSMLGGAGSDFPAVLCFRTAPPMRLPRVLYAAVPELHELGVQSGSVVTFETTLTQVRPPSPGLIIPTLRRMDIDAAFPTRAARAAAYATRLARDTDYSKAGLAG